MGIRNKRFNIDMNSGDKFILNSNKHRRSILVSFIGENEDKYYVFTSITEFNSSYISKHYYNNIYTIDKHLLSKWIKVL